MTTRGIEKKHDIRIGSKTFPGSQTVDELLQQHLFEKLGQERQSFIVCHVGDFQSQRKKSLKTGAIYARVQNKVYGIPVKLLGD